MDRRRHRGAMASLVAVICFIASCAVRPGVDVTLGFEPERDYGAYRTFQVKASDVGPPVIQAHIAETLTMVLAEKGLIRATTPDVLFTLDWSAEDATCPWFIDSDSDESPCRSAGGAFTRIRAHIKLEGREVSTGTPIWAAEIGAVRTMPVQSPTAAQIQAIFVPVFRKALNDFPIRATD